MSDITKPFKSIFGQERAEANPSHFETPTRDLSALLMKRATGEADSLAELQTTNALDTNLQNTITAIKSASGVSPALRARMISRAGESTGTQIAKQGGELRLAEQQNAERNLGQILTGARGQDISAFEQEQDRRNFLKDAARGAGAAIAPGATG